MLSVLGGVQGELQVCRHSTVAAKPPVVCPTWGAVLRMNALVAGILRKLIQEVNCKSGVGVMKKLLT